MSEPAVLRLLGDEHERLNVVATTATGTDAAGALSRGRFPKPQRLATDPNEDGLVVARGARGVLVAVADGHFGFTAARTALDVVAARAHEALDVDDARASTAIEALFVAARRAVLAQDEEVGAAGRRSGTTLSIALVCGRSLHAATAGDSLIALVRRSQLRRSTAVPPGAGFLTAAASLPGARRWRLRPGDKVVVASDGLSDALGRRWLSIIAAELRGEAGDAATDARRLVEKALDTGASDNVAVGVVHV